MGVFISYRRPVSTIIAGAVYHHLVMQRCDAFMDTETVDTDLFDAVLLRQMDARAHFLVILTPGDLALYARPEDWQRRKILHALATERSIIALLVNGFSFAAAAPFFSGGLERLAQVPAVAVTHTTLPEALHQVHTLMQAAPPVPILATPGSEEEASLRKTHRIARLMTVTPAHLQAEECFQRAFTRPAHDHLARATDFTDAVAFYPEYAAAWLQRSISRRILGDFEGAIADAAEAIRLQPKDATAYSTRGIAHYLHGSNAAAIDDYTTALRWQPWEAATLLNRGDAHRAGGAFAAALDDYSAALERCPLTTAAYADFCQQFNLAPVRNVPEALAQFKRLCFIASSSRGEIYRIQQDMPAAIADFTAALALFPDDVAALLNRAQAAMQLDDMPAARRDLDTALTYDPANATLYHQRGFVHHESGDLPAALADYTQALALNPHALLTCCNRAEVLLELGEYEAALQDWNTAHELRPGYPLTLAGLALTHYFLGNTELATDVWRLLAGADARFGEAAQVGRLLNWKAPLLEPVQRLLETLAG